MPYIKIWLHCVWNTKGKQSLLTKDIRQKLYQKHGLEDNFIFGFFGNNQIRKDPLRVIKAFFEVKKEYPNCCPGIHENQFHLRWFVL